MVPLVMSGAALACFHDAVAGPRNYHKPGIGYAPRKLLGDAKDAVIGAGTGGAEGTDLANIPVGREQREGVAHLLDRCGDNLEITGVRAGAKKCPSGDDEIVHQALPAPILLGGWSTGGRLRRHHGQRVDTALLTVAGPPWGCESPVRLAVVRHARSRGSSSLHVVAGGEQVIR